MRGEALVRQSEAGKRTAKEVQGIELRWKGEARKRTAKEWR